MTDEKWKKIIEQIVRLQHGLLASCQPVGGEIAERIFNSRYVETAKLIAELDADAADAER